MSQQPNRPELSGRLKQLRDAEAPLSRPAFGVDDVIRGGRRRQRRRTMAQGLTAVVAAAALGAGIALPQVRGDGDRPVPPAVAPASTPSTPALPAVNLSEDPSVRYQQAGAKVTITRKDGPVAVITLTSAQYTDNSGHLVFRVTADRALTVNTDAFVLYSDDGGENSVEKAATLHYPVGTHTLVLDWKDTAGVPQAAGWSPANGSATWPRSK